MVYSQKNGDVIKRGFGVRGSGFGNAFRYSAYLFVMLFISQNSLAQNKSDSVTAPLDEYRHFIMPTGKPITGGYVGFWELAFLQAGIGFGNFLSVSGGITA